MELANIIQPFLCNSLTIIDLMETRVCLLTCCNDDKEVYFPSKIIDPIIVGSRVRSFLQKSQLCLYRHCYSWRIKTTQLFEITKSSKYFLILHSTMHEIFFSAYKLLWKYTDFSAWANFIFVSFKIYETENICFSFGLRLMHVCLFAQLFQPSIYSKFQLSTKPVVDYNLRQL